MQELIDFSHYLADEAGIIIRPYFRQKLEITDKEDKSPVTLADQAVESILRKIIEGARPDDGIIGEEYGTKEGKNSYQWVIDPIDGTKSFIAGRPTFGTLIALCENGIPILGIIDQPITQERWIGAKGYPTLFNRQPVHTIPCPLLRTARLGSTSPSQIPTLWQKLNDASRFFIWGGDCYSYGLMTLGGLDAVIESLLSPYDFAALPPIIAGAGGWMGDWQGRPLTLQSSGQTLAIGDIALKDQIIEILQGI